MKLLTLAALVLFCGWLTATETENLNFNILPKPGAVVIDGKDDDWDLSGGIFACGDVENARETFSVWIHGMYDADNLYILARWNDRTPMNHPGSTKGDYGFNGDCLQIRIVTAPDLNAPEVARPGNNSNDAKLARTSHMTCWRDRDGLDVIDLEYGHRFNEGKVRDAKTIGAQQAFQKWADDKGYNQEIAIPWKILTKPDVALKAGDRIQLTFEPNFTIGSAGRLTIKDVFKSGVPIDRIFTFQGNSCWGFGTLEAKGPMTPRAVRLSDNREFPVRLENKIPVVDWTGIIKSREPLGFKPIKFTMPEDGYVSLNLFRPDGSVARQLLTCAFYTKGEHEVKWDGLTTMSVRRPGEPLAAGEYTWAGIYHTGVGLRLRGWAGNSSDAPWGNVWGADHGNPIACAASNDLVYLGWGGGEGAKPLQACDANGNIKWKNIRGGIASAGPIAADETTVYAFNSVGQYATSGIYRVDSKTGNYTEWTALKTTDLTMKDLWGDGSDLPKSPTALAAKGGKLFISFREKNAILAVDKTGKVAKSLKIPRPGGIAALSPDKLIAISDRDVVTVNVETGEVAPFINLNLPNSGWASALTIDKAGNVYVGVQGKNHQVLVYSPDGQPLRKIGREGGRELIGPWTHEGMLNISAIAVDAKNQLWVAEDDGAPRRVSVWDSQSGAFVKEFFGATTYGAGGGAINPVDPYLMVGQGCEWRLDPQTGKASCLGVITRDGMDASRFGFGENGRLYLAVSSGFLHGTMPVYIYERLGDARYILRSKLWMDEKDKTVWVWSDEDGHGEIERNEIAGYPMDLGGWFQGWYMSMAPDLSFYGSQYQVKVTGWTSCGAPKYDLAKATKLPAPANVRARGGMGAQRGHGSADGKFMLWNGVYGEDHSTVDCYDIASGKLMWTYPNNFTGVHGSHRACSAEVGMMRGAYDITGTAKLPDPIGNIWVIPTNKGEWHALTDKGFYLTRFFEGDPMKNAWPEKAAPGAILDACPPGAGEEAFGGSISCSKDGKLSLQAGHTSFWNVEVVGMETVRALPAGGKLSLSDDDVKTAQSFREKYLQDSSGGKKIAIKKATPNFSGDIQKDFANQAQLSFKKLDSAAVHAALTWDAENLYVGWDVKDDTPWINGSDAPEFLYARGDTVDLQLGTDPKANPQRGEAALGDLRLSIGSYKGKPTAVIYRRVANTKNPKSFSSGVVKDYKMESVVVAADAKINVKIDAVNKRYTVEAAIPFKTLEFAPGAGLKIRGDIGVTHSNKAGDDTALRTYWSSQQTGLVSDEVFELQMEPKNWGEIEFQE